MKVAVAQLTTGIDPAAAASHVDAIAGEAAAAGAVMLFTPEMTNIIDSDRARSARHVVMEEDDLVVRAARSAARRHALWIHLGSVAVQVGEDRRANRGLLIDSSGEIRARYDKIHLFDADVGTADRWRESSLYLAGDRAVVAKTPLGPMGLTICYDLRFPDLFRALSDAGATLLSVPAAFTVPSGEAHWHVLLRARAIEAGAWVVAAAQTGRHQDGRTTYGHSLVVDPWGEVVLDMGQGAGIGYAEIDVAAVEKARSRIPALRHRRRIDLVVGDDSAWTP